MSGHTVSLPPAQPKKRRNPPPLKGGKPSTVTKRKSSLRLKYAPPPLAPIEEHLGPQHEDTILAAIESGMLITEIAQQIGRTQSILSRYLNDPSRQAKVRESRRLSAVYWDECAQRVIEDLPSNATPADCLRARELASHFRWRAKSIAPNDYGGIPAMDAEEQAARQANALSRDAAMTILGGIMAAIGLQVSELPKDKAGRIIDHESGT